MATLSFLQWALPWLRPRSRAPNGCVSVLKCSPIRGASQRSDPRASARDVPQYDACVCHRSCGYLWSDSYHRFYVTYVSVSSHCSYVNGDLRFCENGCHHSSLTYAHLCGASRARRFIYVLLSGDGVLSTRYLGVAKLQVELLVLL